MIRQNQGSLVQPLFPSGDSWNTLFPLITHEGRTKEPDPKNILLSLTGDVLREFGAPQVALAFQLVGAIGNSDYKKNNFLGVHKTLEGVGFTNGETLKIFGQEPEKLSLESRQNMKKAIVDFLIHLETFLNGSQFYQDNPLGSLGNLLEKVEIFRDLYKDTTEMDYELLGKEFGFKPGTDKVALLRIVGLILDQTVETKSTIKESIETIGKGRLMICVGEPDEGKSTLAKILVEGNDYAPKTNNGNGKPKHLDDEKDKNKKKRPGMLNLSMDKPANYLASMFDKRIPHFKQFALEMPAYALNGSFSVGFLHALGIEVDEKDHTQFFIPGFPKNTIFSHEFIEHAIQKFAQTKQVKICCPVKIGEEETYERYKDLRMFLHGDKYGLEDWIDQGFGREHGKEAEYYFDYFCRLSKALPKSVMQGLYSSVLNNVPFIPVPTPRAFTIKRETMNVEAEYIKAMVDNQDLDNFEDPEIMEANFKELVGFMVRLEPGLNGNSDYKELYNFAIGIRDNFKTQESMTLSNGLLRLVYSLMVMEADYKCIEKKLQMGKRRKRPDTTPYN
jgi:hypothetical protein